MKKVSMSMKTALALGAFIYVNDHEFVVESLRHLTPANSTKRERQGKKWKTVATIRDTYNNVTATAEAWCSRRDVPNRKLGREIAIGRAIRKLAPLR